MSQQRPDDVGLDHLVQRRVDDAVRRRLAQHAADAASAAGTLASDNDREEVSDVLNEAFALGRLTSEEHAERTTRALTARTHGELEETLAGLHLPVPQVHLRKLRSAVFWAAALFATPFLLVGLALLAGGDDLEEVAVGAVFLAASGSGLFRLRRWAFRRSGDSPRIRLG